ncbi:MAG: hypothetical protein ACFFAS_18735 [Promethearchaeota archaeon]
MQYQVKGTALKDFVIGIRSDRFHKEEYDRILSDVTKDLLNQRILNSIWYSYEIYVEIFNAIAKVIAKNNREIVIKWGRDFGEKVMVTIYKNLIVEGNIKKLLEMYPRFHRMIFNFGTLTPEWISRNEILFTYKDFDTKFEMVYYSNIGWTQRAIEMCIKKKVNYKFVKKFWEGDDVTQFRLFWTP